MPKLIQYIGIHYLTGISSSGLEFPRDHKPLSWERTKNWRNCRVTRDSISQSIHSYAVPAETYQRGKKHRVQVYTKCIASPFTKGACPASNSIYKDSHLSFLRCQMFCAHFLSTELGSVYFCKWIQIYSSFYGTYGRNPLLKFRLIS
jgi:hypothetical protein